MERERERRGERELKGGEERGKENERERVRGKGRERLAVVCSTVHWRAVGDYIYIYIYMGCERETERGERERDWRLRVCNAVQPARARDIATASDSPM